MIGQTIPDTRHWFSRYLDDQAPEWTSCKRVGTNSRTARLRWLITLFTAELSSPNVS